MAEQSPGLFGRFRAFYQLQNGAWAFYQVQTSRVLIKIAVNRPCFMVPGSCRTENLPKIVFSKQPGHFPPFTQLSVPQIAFRERVVGDGKVKRTFLFASPGFSLGRKPISLTFHFPFSHHTSRSVYNKCWMTFGSLSCGNQRGSVGIGGGPGSALSALQNFSLMTLYHTLTLSRI